MANHYDIPSWAGKPVTGLHLDVTKDGKLFQKLMIDQKKCYLFGRNPQMNDFQIDHASCSRVHSALVWHKHLNRAFLVDLGSTHGTFIGSMRIESHKPTQLPIDSTFHFGASSRQYIIRERPQNAMRPILEELEEEAKTESYQDGGLLGLPETEMELDNLTEFNTAHNRRISMQILGLSEDDANGRNGVRKRKKQFITFNDEEEVINPEDIDPTVGRFRNLVQTTVIPTKRMKSEKIPPGTLPSGDGHYRKALHYTSGDEGLYGGLPPEMAGHMSQPTMSSSLFSTSLATKLGLPLLPNPAPDVDLVPQEEAVPPAPTLNVEFAHPSSSDLEPKKKKYAKEAWPGKKPAPSLLV